MVNASIIAEGSKVRDDKDWVLVGLNKPNTFMNVHMVLWSLWLVLFIYLIIWLRAAHMLKSDQSHSITPLLICGQIKVCFYILSTNNIVIKANISTY